MILCGEKSKLFFWNLDLFKLIFVWKKSKFSFWNLDVFLIRILCCLFVSILTLWFLNLNSMKNIKTENQKAD